VFYTVTHSMSSMGEIYYGARRTPQFHSNPTHKEGPASVYSTDRII